MVSLPKNERGRYYDWLVHAAMAETKTSTPYWLAANDHERKDVYVRLCAQIDGASDPDDIDFRSRVLHAHKQAGFDQPVFELAQKKKRAPRIRGEKIHGQPMFVYTESIRPLNVDATASTTGGGHSIAYQYDYDELMYVSGGCLSSLEIVHVSGGCLSPLEIVGL